MSNVNEVMKRNQNPYSGRMPDMKNYIERTKDEECHGYNCGDNLVPEAAELVRPSPYEFAPLKVWPKDYTKQIISWWNRRRNR